MSITAALLAYKEAENLRVLLPKIKSQLELTGETFEIIVVDSAEPLDDTAEVCAQFGARYINQEEPFFGGAFRTAIRHASLEKFLILDADCSHDPAAIPAINAKFEESGADLVIGSRYTEGGVSNDSALSRVMSGMLNGMFRKALGVQARDISTDYRMYRTKDLKKADLRCERYDVLQEVILQIKMNNGGSIAIEEVPIEFQKRAFGRSKRQLFVFIMHYLRTIVSLTVQRALFDRSVDKVANPERAELITNIVLYTGIGSFGALVDYAFFCLANVIWKVPEISNVMGAFAGFVFTMYFNTFFNFISRGHFVKKFISYAIVCLIGTFVSTGMIYVFKQYLNVYVLKVFCIIVAAAVQFVLNRNITYRLFGDEGPRNPNAR